MLTRLKRLLAAPVFEGDEEKTRTAKLLNVILLTNLAISATSGAVLPFTGNFVNGAVPVGVMVLMMLGALFLLRSGRVRLASWLFSILHFVIDVLLLFVSGGISSPITSFIVVVVIACRSRPRDPRPGVSSWTTASISSKWPRPPAPTRH
jgi:hypothetical protein